MPQNLEVFEQPAQNLPVQNLPIEEKTENQKPGSLFQPRKRSGSKSKDTLRKAQVVLLKTGAYGSIGLSLLSITLISTFLLLLAGVEIYMHFHPQHVSMDFKRDVSLWQYALNVGMMLSPFVIGSCVFGGVGLKAKKWAAKLDSDLPVQNAAALPASESLLRGSAEPLQEEGAVLLRAAGQGPKTPAEHLLRAAGELQE
ncbi:MAG: hypothetical protein JWN14_1807 [Chthonomonadales bacterium]|nr:hypothetical protein [Chthonomonadales bacterium]